MKNFKAGTKTYSHDTVFEDLTVAKSGYASDRNNVQDKTRLKIASQCVFSICCILAFLLLSLFFAENAYAANTVTSATLNSVASINVAPGSTITMTVTNTTSGGTSWGSTLWLISTTTPSSPYASSMNCDTAPTPTISGNGTNTTTLAGTVAITAPLVAGTYNVYFVTSSNATNCGNTQSALYTMAGAVTVTALTPVVATSAATAITATGATLNGTVSCNGASTTATYNYGLTTSYGSTATSSLGTCSNNTGVPVAITGLACGSLYHFKLTATNSAGTGSGSDQSFTTSACTTPAVTTNAASSISGTGATLNGTVNGNGASTTVSFNYGLTTSYGSTVTASQSPLAFNTGSTAVTGALTGLTCGTSYHFQVTATNSTGTTNGADANFTTPVCAPTATTNAATTITSTSAVLNGIVSSNGATTTVGFNYGLTTSYGSTATATQSPLAATASGTAVSAAITGLACNTLYHFQVTATNSAGTTNGLDSTFTTPVCAPTVTTNAASSITVSGATLNGSVSSNGAISTVSFQYGTTTAYGSTQTATQSPLSATASNAAVSAAITGLSCNTTYHFLVTATNSAGSNYGADTTFTTSNTACSTITNISPISVSAGAAQFTLTINGTGFTSGSKVWLNGLNPVTTYVNSTKLTAIIPASYLTSATTYSVTVITGSDTSNAVSFTVLPTSLPPMPTTCFTDSFTTLNSANWNVTGSYIPNITISGRLRLTPATIQLKSMAQLERWFPGANNTIVVTFDYFSYGGGGADGTSVVLSDASTTPAPGGYGGSLGYAQTNNPNTYGFNGGWLGVGLDDYGNYSNTNESRTGYNTGWTPPTGANAAAGFNPNAIAVRSSGSNYSGYSLMATNTNLSPALWTSASTQTTAQRFRIYFDHSNSVNGWLTVQRDTTGTGSSFTTLIPTFDVMAANGGQFAVPTNFYLSFASSTGAVTNIHEIGNVNICATIMEPVGGGLDHLQITGNSSGTTCAPTSLTITACANAPCTAYYTSTAVSGTLTASTTVNWDPNGVGASANFTIPAGSSSITVPVLVTTSGATTFGINPASITPTAINTTVCNLNSTNACVFTASSVGISLSVPNHISCTNQAVTLTGCGSSYANGSHTTTLYMTYLNPATGTQPATVTYQNGPGSGNTASTTLSTSSSSPTSLTNLYFNSSAAASSIILSYPDVGKLGLNAAYPGSTGTTTFIAVPASFLFSNITAAPLVAGKNFNATVTAMNQCTTPTATPNFGMETSPESATLSYAKYQPTGSGAVNGSFSGAVGSFTNGVASSSNLNWSEVGTIDLHAILTSGNYLGSGLAAATGTTGSTGAVGAFIPDHFNTTVTEACIAGAFTYSGQPFTATVTALNALGAITQNYDGSVNTTPNFSKAVSLSEVNGIAGSLSPASLAATSFTAGVANVIPTYTFTTNPTTPSLIKLRAVDTSNVSSATGAEGTASIYSGCFKMINNYGSELLDLSLPMTAQYWNGSNWITNTSDSCTNTTLSFTSVTSPDITGKTCVIESANNSGKGCGVTPAISDYQFLEGGLTGIDSNGVAGFAGNFNLWLQAPGTGNTGAINVRATSPSWLQCSSGYTARATFGIFNGNSKQIYFRELY